MAHPWRETLPLTSPNTTVAVLLDRSGFRVVVAEKQRPISGVLCISGCDFSLLMYRGMEIVPRAFSLSHRWIAHVRRQWRTILRT